METKTTALKLSKFSAGDTNWDAQINANFDKLDAYVQRAFLLPPNSLLASLGAGAVGANLLANTSYFYKVTAINAAGETTERLYPSVLEAQVSEPAAAVPIILSWEASKGATGYRIYKGTASGSEVRIAEVVGENTIVFTDDGSFAPTATPVPAENTAAIVVGGGGGVTDHGLLTGLGDDDHAQYHNDARGDARYIAKSIGTMKGDIISFSLGGTPGRLQVGADGQVLTADAASPLGVKWATPAGGGGAPGGTSGQLQYNNAGAFGGTAGMVWDAVNSRLGIGTLGPEANLHVAGTLRFVDGNQAVGKVLVSDANGGASWQTFAGSSVPGWEVYAKGTTPGNDTQFAIDPAVKDWRLQMFIPVGGGYFDLFFPPSSGYSDVKKTKATLTPDNAVEAFATGFSHLWDGASGDGMYIDATIKYTYNAATFKYQIRVDSEIHERGIFGTKRREAAYFSISPGIGSGGLPTMQISGASGAGIRYVLSKFAQQ